MEVLNFNELDFSELKELAGGEEFTYSGGCGLWNGKSPTKKRVTITGNTLVTHFFQ